MNRTAAQMLIDHVTANPSPGSVDARATILDALRNQDGEWNFRRCAHLLAGGADAARAAVLNVVSRIDPDGSPAARTQLADELVAEVLAAPVELSGAHVVAALFAVNDIERVFVYAGTSELSLCDALEATPGIRLTNARGDKESAFMAAGGSVLRPGVAAAILHGARGLTNAAGGLAEARRNEVGAVFIVGLPTTGSSRFLPPHGEEGLLDAMGTFARWTWEAPAVPQEPEVRLDAAVRYVSKLREAIATARNQPHGPALFGLPQDVAELSWIPLMALVEGKPSPARTVSERPHAAAVRMLKAARRPVVLIDDYALHSPGVRASLDRISRRLGAPVVQLRYRRGPMLFERLQTSEVGNFAGWLNQHSAEHMDLLRDCDLLITVEDRNMYRRVVGDLPTCRKIAVTTDPAKAYKNEYLSDEDAVVEGDPALILDSLAIELEEREQPLWSADGVRKASAVNPEPPRDEVFSWRRNVAGLVAGVLAGRPNPVLVDDSQMLGGLLAEHYDDMPPGLRVMGSHGGFVGGGLASAIGLALSEPGSRVVCTLGDQAFTNSFQALVAAVQERAPLLIVVCNNGRSVSLTKQAVASYGAAPRDYLDNVTGFGYAEVAAAVGLWARRLAVPVGSTADDIASAAALLAQGAAVDGPALVELVVPSDPEAWRGIWLATGFEQLAPVTVG